MSDFPMNTSETSETKPALYPYSYWIVLLASGGALAVAMGVRNTMGMFVSPINTSTGLGLVNVSLAFAIGQLWWGLTQPFAGAIADRVGTGRVVFSGLLLVTVGTFLAPFMNSLPGLIFAIAVLSAGGAGLAGPAVLMAATNRLIAPEKRGMASGIVNAGSSFGQFMMAPIAAALTINLGWSQAMQGVALLVLLALPAAYILKGNSRQIIPSAVQKPLSASAAIKQALNTPSYLLLAAGFFVCGFHVAFLSTHLPGVIAACGLPTQWAGWSLALIGLFNILGSLGIGWAVSKWRMKSLLSIIYALRALAVLAFLMAPKTGSVMLAFAAVMGLTFLSTVPPTAGLVAKFFGPSNMAMLFGMVMVTHQIGGFLGAWLGGKIFASTGSYDWVWYIDIVLAVAAALIHLPIKESVLPRPALVS
jgi:predicted MFS family arabinose efflux permease